MGNEIMFEVSGQEVRGYLAQPEYEHAPGILLLPSWWGLNDFFRNTADRIAQEGYVVLALDYYGGKLAATIEEAKQLKSTLDRELTNKLMKGALHTLQEFPTVSSDKLGVIGFSLGCGFALGLVRSEPDKIAAAVLFYGTGGGKYGGLEVDFLGHFAETDKWGTHPQKVKALEERLSKSKGQVEFYTYPKTEHWFFEADRTDAYNKDAADQAWKRTIKFLHSRLRRV